MIDADVPFRALASDIYHEITPLDGVKQVIRLGVERVTMKRSEYEHLWNMFCLNPDLDEVPYETRKAFTDWLNLALEICPDDYGFEPPLVGYSKANKCVIAAFFWYENSKYFDIAFFDDGRMGWYLRPPYGEIVGCYTPETYQRWSDAPFVPLSGFETKLEDLCETGRGITRRDT